MPKTQHTIHANLKQKFLNRQSATEFKFVANQLKSRIKRSAWSTPLRAWKKLHPKVGRAEESLKVVTRCNWD